MRLLIILLTILLPTFARALTPIARVDVVPLQRINSGETFNFGVVAFSKEGIQKVDFVISGQGYSAGTKTSTAMTYNARTDVWEYWVPISASEFTSDGSVTVTATVTGNDAGTKTLDAITMFVNPNGTMADYAAWVDGTNGNDSTGAVDTESSPYLTIAGAMDGLLAANGNDLAGCTIYLEAGTYNFAGVSKTRTVSNEWLTIAAADGVASTDAIINGTGNASVLAYLHVHGVTIQQVTAGSDGGDAVINDTYTINIWTSHCRLIGSGRYSGEYSNPVFAQSTNNSYAEYWSTDCYTYDVFDAYLKITMVRGATIQNVGDDVFKNTPFVVNCVVDNIDNGGSGSHADAFQLHTANSSAENFIDPQDNIIVYGYKVTNAHYQGIFLGCDEETTPNDVRTNCAFVNVVIEMAEPANNNGTGGYVLTAASFGNGWNHLLVWNCTFTYAPVVILPTASDTVTNLSVVGNTFWQLRYNGSVNINNHNPPLSEPSNAYNNEFQDNHYYHIYGITETCTGTSIDISKSHPCPHWHARAYDSDGGGSYTSGTGVLDANYQPLAASGLLGRFTSRVPVDISNRERGSLSDVGAYEWRSLHRSGGSFGGGGTIY